MTFLGFTGLINALTCIFLGIFVLLKNRRNIQNISYFILNSSVALYSFGYFFWQLSTDATAALAWFKILTVGIILINNAYLFFVFVFVNILSKRKRLLLACLVANILFIALNFNNQLYTALTPRYNLGFWPVPTNLFNVYLTFWFWQCFYGLYCLVKGQRIAVGRRKEQIKYFMIAAVFGFFGGATNWPMWYNIHISPYPNVLISVYIGIVAYAIIRHQLMDIEVIIKKTLVYAGLFTFAFGVIVSIAMITQELLPQLLAINRFVSLAISAVIIVFSLRPLENFLVNATNKYLFQKHYDLDRVCKATIDTLVKNLYLTNCAVLLLSRDETGYEIYDSYGIQDKDAYLVNEDSIIRRLKVTQAPILYQSYDSSLQASDDIKKDMDKIKSALCMPLVIHNELVGILSLGAKKSDQAYTDDDVDILTTLDKALSIAISNAKLFTQAAQYEKLAAIGTLASSVNHEVCNPLNNISIRMQVFSENLRRGLYKDKSTDELLKEAEKIMDHSIGQIERVAAITSKLSSFAKPSKEAAARPVDIAQSVDDALSVVGHELELNKIKLEKNIPSDLLKIMADEDQMQQVFFNLIRNAAQAVEENGTITITAKEDNNRIKVEVADTGCGIPEDKLNKIFEPFYTTKDKVKGSGFGLAIVRELIWRNKGNISVKSKQGEGTTFYLEFPKA